MTTRPELNLGAHLWRGISAVALFVVLAVVFLRANFAEPVGFPTDASITANIGYAMFDMAALQSIEAEGFLVAFIVIAFVLDAALEGAVMLASREEAGDVVSALRAIRGGGE